MTTTKHSTILPPSAVFLISFSHSHLNLYIVRDFHNFLSPVILVQFIVSYMLHHRSKLATYCSETYNNTGEILEKTYKEAVMAKF